MIRCKPILLLCILLSCSRFFADNTAKRSLSIHQYRPFVVLICSYNNEVYVKKNLESVFSQSYKNFRVIYVDDHSSDSTYCKMMEMVRNKHNPCKVQVYRNSQNLGGMFNTYRAVHSMRNWEIVVILDGDDWFPHPDVLKNLNSYYQSDNVWLTYGQYREWPSGRIGLNAPCSIEELRHAQLRKKVWKTSHLRTFYAGLFKKIHKNDLMHQKKFISASADQAFMLPMLDMAREHAFFIPEVMYIYNKSNANSDFRHKAKEQLDMKAYIRQLPPYPILQTHPAR
ncbi:MAG: glycosyltransferase family 2 protein [Simkaniaceae bacterium]|nr:glycosyltransferase family 2 protein [Simkaniaceae bacterium]